MKQMEKKVNELIEESCFANDRMEYQLVRNKVLWYSCQISENVPIIIIPVIDCSSVP